MFDDRMQAGYVALQAYEVSQACDPWLEVWEGFKLHLGPAVGRVGNVDALFHGTEFFFDWCQEFEQELGNAGAIDPRYLRARVRYVNEIMAQFDAEDDEQLLGNFMRILVKYRAAGGSVERLKLTDQGRHRLRRRCQPNSSRTPKNGHMGTTSAHLRTSNSPAIST